jgi:hypothetical protein
MRSWKLTNCSLPFTAAAAAAEPMQVFQASARVTDMVGLANGGISSDIASRMHKMQGIYGKR